MARGDQIYAIQPLAELQGVYEHHGIDCGDGTAIHLRKGNATISRSPLDEFALGQTLYVKRYRTSLTPEAVVHRAESRLGERAQYNLLFNNCEHFATWCKTGIHHSQQVQDFLPFLNSAQLDSLSEPLRRSLETGPSGEARELVDRALGELKTVWNEVQPRYARAKQEAQAWERVAKQALQSGREDLARAALERKYPYQQQVAADQEILDRLARTTQMLLRDRPAGPAR